MPPKKSNSKIQKTFKRYDSKKPVSKKTYNAVRKIVNKTLNRVIETKESTRSSTISIGLPHNNTYIVQDAALSANLNPFYLAQGTADPMAGNTGNRLGDSIVPKGMLIKGMVEGALSRSKVHFKIMLLRGPIGASFARADVFKGNSNNKLLDQINTERYKLIAITKFNVSPPNTAAASVSATGTVAAAPAAGVTGNKVFSLWIPGKAFGRQLKYENNSLSQVKYYDYRIVIVAYDWYGTPQDINNVGILNELYTKLYFKDA